MKTRVEETTKRHQSGYNCAQAVACTYCDLVGMDEATMFRITEAMGLGMGNMEGTCGAVSGACILAGLKNSSANLVLPLLSSPYFYYITFRYLPQKISSLK